MQAAHQARHARCAEQAARAIGQAQGQARRAQQRGQLCAESVGQRAMPGALRTQLAHQVAGVDAYRAALRAQPGGGAGVQPMVLVGLAQGLGVFPGAFAGLDIPPHHDALARAEGQAMRGADRFAKAAFDALVDQFIGGRQRLEVLEVDLWVAAQLYIGVENAVRVEQGFDLPHQLVGILAPFQFDKGRHVASGAMLGLQ